MGRTDHRAPGRAIKIILTGSVMIHVFGVNLAATLGGPGDIYNLGTLPIPSQPSIDTSSQGVSINSAGQVSGMCHGPLLSELYVAFGYNGVPGSGGAMVDLGSFGGTETKASDINAAGQIAGYSATSTNIYSPMRHAFRYTGTPGSGGVMADLGTLGGMESLGLGINDAGHVVGGSNLTTNSNLIHAFIYTGTPGSGGTMIDIDTPDGDSLAYDINNLGQVTGEKTVGNHVHAFLYTGAPGVDGKMIDLGTLGGNTSFGYAINEAGQIAGLSAVGPNSKAHAFRYTGTPGLDGVMADLGALDGTESSGQGINDAGFVVGWFRSAADGYGTRAALWLTDANNTGVDLNAWLDATNPALGAFWQLAEADDINSNGLITGYGNYNDGPGGLSDGPRAFILDASSLVPEPSFAHMLAASGLTLLLRRSRVEG